jgi:tetratricopeptide (TPR) repeat protein
MSRVSTLFVAVCLLGGRAWAGNSEAEELFRSGRQLAKEGNYEAACTAFEKSNELDPNTNTLLNLADCEEKNHKLATAWRAFVDVAERTRGGAQ